MADLPDGDPGAVLRRAPFSDNPTVGVRGQRAQQRILEAALQVFGELGYHQTGINRITEVAGCSRASFYQYFSDKEDVLLALAQRDMEEMDAQVLADLQTIEVLSVESLVRTVMGAFVTVYHRRRAFVEIYLRGRNNPAVHQFGREHNAAVAEMLRAFAVDAGIARADMPPRSALLAVEIGDRVFQLAFEHDPEGDPALVEEGMTLVSAYLERYATPAGLDGVRQ